MKPRFIALIALGLGLACGKDSSGPGGVTFPSLPSNMLATFCVRGEGLVGQTKSGSVTSGDCDAGDVDPADSSYYEVWRVRVASVTSVTFDANSAFDNYLTVLRLDSYTSNSASLTLMGENDDRQAGVNLNALVTVTLQPNTDYFVSISGYDYSETGPYSLQIR
jgi:hypothetical protein